eukprot:CAMPEP_0119135338 /NCGR_PEP_ID=MMETSP1310-20130426/19088_1 /TAXON_ID=464262 /ORGANISM="Genus nov. species nov., Strain RCC2339" /LENGTH=811 /DNA_ID=CAMNT_0007126213 /DNA_START=33 /DNA_END=2468 /DNA_ORIENTATION=-
MSSQIPYTTPVRERHQFSVGALQAHLAKAIDFFVPPIAEVRQFEGGQSNPTFWIRDSAGHEMVLRKKPGGPLLPRAHLVEREYTVMKALYGTDVPVPQMYCLADDPSIIGTPFYVMEFIRGRIFRDIMLPSESPENRRAIYIEAVDVLARISSVRLDAVGLENFGSKRSGYYPRQFRRWSAQYEKASQLQAAPPGETDEQVRKIMNWLGTNLPSEEGIIGRSLVHGDFRLDNLVFHPTEPRVLAVVDWELSTVGHAYNDIANFCLPYHLPSAFLGPLSNSSAEPQVHTIVTERDLLAHYLRRRSVSLGVPSAPTAVEGWEFYLLFSLFRLISICQGVYARGLLGNASDETGILMGKQVQALAKAGDGFLNAVARTDTTAPVIAPASEADFTAEEKRVLAGAYPPLFPVSVRAKCIYVHLLRFINAHVKPMEQEVSDTLMYQPDRWSVVPQIEELKQKAREAGLWNLWLPKEYFPKYGAGLTNVEYAAMAAVMGRTLFASEVFNCSAPDTGNMEVLLRFGSEEQKRKWLDPLIRGEIRSCFGMTEPAVASSDARNIRSSIRKEGSDYIITGRKWWTSGAGDPRCKVCIFMGQTDPAASAFRQQSMVVVPMDAPGVSKVRPLSVFGYDDAPHGHYEVLFENVRVPQSSIIWGEGRGFEIAQARLGPGRIHHCMRVIGISERALELMCQRAMKRETFGKKLAYHGTVQKDIADSRADIEQARLLTMGAAAKIDVGNAKLARKDIAMIKVVAPNMGLRVIDRAIQVHGGAGVSQDFPLAYAYAQVRTLRLADGPDEVHRRTIAKLEVSEQMAAKL